jgi:hypothetical protein
MPLVKAWTIFMDFLLQGTSPRPFHSSRSQSSGFSGHPFFIKFDGKIEGNLIKMNDGAILEKKQSQQ